MSEARVVALLSGGLDSTLAARILQQQGVEVHGLNVRPVFGASDDAARAAAELLGVPLDVRDVGDDYLVMLRHPRYGYGRGMNPCVDCRIYMARIARQRMLELEACAVVSGEVLGQRPMSQRRHDLAAVAQHAELEDRLLRPLSAKRLAPTIPEREGLIDRERLYAFTGRGRRPLLDLAKRLGVPPSVGPAGGCPLTEPLFARKVRDLFRHRAEPTRFEFDLLPVGKHFRYDAETKIVAGWNERENAQIRAMAARPDCPDVALLHPESFPGPDAMVIGRISSEAIGAAAALIVRRGRPNPAAPPCATVTRAGRRHTIHPSPTADPVKRL